MIFGLELHQSDLDRLPASLKLALAASCAQRHSGVYDAYTKRTHAGNARLFNQGLELMWKETQSNKWSVGELEGLADHIVRLLPSKRRAPCDVYESNAEYALLALTYCIRTRIRGKTADVIYAAAEVFDSIDDFLTNWMRGAPEIDQNHPQWNEHLSRHSLIRAEHLRQERDLLDIQGVDSDSAAEIIAKMRCRAEIDSKSFLPTEVMATMAVNMRVRS
jgi:hypothetical protein